MNTNHFVLINLLIAALTLVFIAACQPNSTETVSPIIKTTLPPSPTGTATPVASPTPTPTPEDMTVTLTFWTIEPISAEAEGEAGDFISTSLYLFERANPRLEVEVILKKAAGKGGTLDFLRSAKAVAPSVMPDVAILNVTDLNQAYNEGLIQSLNGRMDRSIVQDLLPAARKIGTIKEDLVGVPIGLEMEHVVYNTLIFTDTPMLWSDILSRNTVYLFPAKGVNGLVNDATLAQYFSAGGTFFDDQGVPKIDDQVLKKVLTFYKQAQEAGVLDPAVLEAATTEELWPRYLEAQAGIANISVQQYLTDQQLLHNTAFASVPRPNPENTPVVIIHGWALTLVTADPNRQQAALSLLEWFLSTENNVSWNRINQTIPTRDTSYQQLAGEDPYWQFLSDQLNTARPQPNFAEYDRIGRIIQQAVEQVIRGEATPEEATITAIDALAQ